MSVLNDEPKSTQNLHEQIKESTSKDKRQMKEYKKKVESRKTKYQERRKSVARVHEVDPP